MSQMDDLDDLLDDQPLVIDEDELLSAGPVESVLDDELNQLVSQPAGLPPLPP